MGAYYNHMFYQFAAPEVNTKAQRIKCSPAGSIFAMVVLPYRVCLKGTSLPTVLPEDAMTARSRLKSSKWSTDTL